MKRAAPLVICALLSQGYIFSDYITYIEAYDFVNGFLLNHSFDGELSFIKQFCIDSIDKNLQSVDFLLQF